MADKDSHSGESAGGVLCSGFSTLRQNGPETL